LYSLIFIVILTAMLKMRLQRVGRKHEPTFRLVLTDSKNSTKSGRFQEVLGAYDPRRAIDSFKSERIKELVKEGVGLTGSVNNLLIKHGIIRGKKTHVGSNFVVKSVEEAVAAETAPAPEVTTPEAVPEEVSAPEVITEAPAEAAPEEIAPTPEPEEKPAPTEAAPEV
jgi:small subunit ribosomal protein S16